MAMPWPMQNGYRNVQYFLMIVEFGRDPVLLHIGFIRCFWDHAALSNKHFQRN